MSARRASAATGSGGRVAVSALLLVVVAAGMMLLLRARPEPEPFDPRSDAGSGARGLVLLLERQGASVEVVRSVPDAASGRRVLVLDDRLGDQQRAALRSFADAGGVVVMADPASTLLGDLGATSTITDELPVFDSNDIGAQVNVPLDGCQLPALQHLRGVFVRTGERFRDSEATRSCFRNSSGAFVVVRAVGLGNVVQLGDNELFTNSLLRYADNGPLATALLAPTAGSRVSILVGEEAAKTAADIGEGDETLLGLVRPGVWMALTQLAVAFVVFAIARAVRPGRPVREPEQVPVAGSELVVATGNLMQRAHHAERAGWLLRGSLYRDLCNRFAMPATAPVAALDDVVAERGLLPAGRLAAVLEREVHDDAGLLQLSSSLHEIRELTLAARVPGAPPVPDEGVMP